MKNSNKSYILFSLLILSIFSLSFSDSYIMTTKSQMKEKIQLINNSTSIFSTPELIIDMNAKEMIVHDYDYNGFPDIIHFDGKYNEEPKGIFHIQFDESKEWNKSKINDLLQIEEYSNLTGDDTLDFIHHVGESNNHALALSEISDNGGIIKTIIFDDVIYPIEDLLIDDVDCDGDYDIFFAYYTGYVQVYQNLGSGKFNIDWDNGIPDKLKDPTLPNMNTLQVKVGDLNCDGLPDICTAMKSGGGYGTPAGARYFLWLNNGNGSWTDSSKEFPRGREILNIDLADIDNDGDLDYGILGQDEGWIYENIDGKKWNVRPFPNFNPQMNFFTFKDIDLDGNADIFTTDLMLKGNTWHNELNISFGRGDFTWNNVNQLKVLNTSYRQPVFEDFDRDGDLDIVMKGGSNALYWENNISKQNNMSFIKTPSSTHFRSGYLTEFSWTMKDAYRICNQTKDLEFNLSISYTGPEGPFFHLKTVTGQWWTDLIIPDMPSNDVYFRINFSDYSTLSGPYTIHDSEGLGSLIELTDPEYDSYMIGGEDVDVTLRTSRHLQSGTYPLYLVSKENKSYLGSFYLQNDHNNSISITIPHGFYSTYSHLEVTIPWYEDQRDVDTVSRFQIIPTDMIPDHFDTGDHHVPAGYDTNITVTVFSINGTDISSDCEYEILGRSKGIQAYPYKDGIINITCSDVGTFNFTVGTTKYTRSVEANIVVISHPNLDSIIPHHS